MRHKNKEKHFLKFVRRYEWFLIFLLKKHKGLKIFFLCLSVCKQQHVNHEDQKCIYRSLKKQDIYPILMNSLSDQNKKTFFIFNNFMNVFEVLKHDTIIRYFEIFFLSLQKNCKLEKKGLFHLILMQVLN